MHPSNTEKLKTVSWLSKLDPFIPKLFTCLSRGYNSALFFSDLKAGISIGFIALPLAMAFAIGSGVAPERGLYTAIIAGFLISLLGGSRVQIGGPTGAYVVLVYGIVQKHGYEGLALATCLAGVLLIIAGLFRLGSFIRFIPYPVTTGFTAGIATVLFVSQIKEFFGLEIPTHSIFIFDVISSFVQFSDTVNVFTLLLATLTLSCIILLRRLSKKIPAFIIATTLATIATIIWDLPVKTIENSFGAIPNTLLPPSWPAFSSFQAVFADAVAIALLGGIESLLSCIVADNMTGYRHKSNCELIGQGIANIASSLCGGIPATGAIARTGANVQIGGKTPVAGMIHALTVLVLILTVGPYAAKMPLCALSAILFVVAWNMSEIHQIRGLLKGPMSDRIVLASTYLLTVCIDLTFAVQMGFLIALLSFLKKMTDKAKLHTYMTDDDVLNIEFKGPFFFSISEIVHDALAKNASHPKTIVLHMASIPFIDATAIHSLKRFQDKCLQLNIALYITGVQDEVLQALKKSHVELNDHEKYLSSRAFSSACETSS